MLSVVFWGRYTMENRMNEQMERAKMAEWNRRYDDPAGRSLKPSQNDASLAHAPDYQGPELLLLQREIFIAFGCANALAEAVESLTLLLFGESVQHGISAAPSEPCGRVAIMTTEARALVLRAETALRQVERIAQQFG